MSSPINAASLVFNQPGVPRAPGANGGRLLHGRATDRAAAEAQDLPKPKSPAEHPNTGRLLAHPTASLDEALRSLTEREERPGPKGRQEPDREKTRFGKQTAAVRRQPVSPYAPDPPEPELDILI